MKIETFVSVVVVFVKVKLCICVIVNLFYWHVHNAQKLHCLMYLRLILKTTMAYVNFQVDSITKMSFLKCSVLWILLMIGGVTKCSACSC